MTTLASSSIVPSPYDRPASANRRSPSTHSLPPNNHYAYSTQQHPSPPAGAIRALPALPSVRPLPQPVSGPAYSSQSFQGPPGVPDQRLMQAQFQQQQWQEMVYRQQMAQSQMAMAAQQHAQANPEARRRATSGPAPPAHQYGQKFPPQPLPSFHPQHFPQPYSPPSHAAQPYYGPSGHAPFQASHGYLTPPASDPGQKELSSPPTAARDFHPYRRDAPSQQPSSQHRRTETPPLMSAHNFPPLAGSASPPPAPLATTQPVYHHQHSFSNTSSTRSSTPTPPPRSPAGSVRTPLPPPSTHERERTSSAGSSIRGGRTTPTSAPATSAWSTSASPSPKSLNTSVASSTSRPSPLSVAEDRGEESDDTAEAVIFGAPLAAVPQGKGKKGVGSRFRKAFGSSTNIVNIDGSGPTTFAQLPSGPHSLQHGRNDSLSSSTDSSPAPKTPPPPPAAPSAKAKSNRFLFNSKLNSSTDNISISSTVSSASVMIRKLGSLGSKVVRRNSLMNLTKFGKDKSKDKDEKASAATASTSHVTAEMDDSASIRASVSGGMSPAAALARKHQDLYKAQEEEEAKVAAAAAALAAERKAREGQGRAKTTDDVVLSSSATNTLSSKKKGRRFLGLGGKGKEVKNAVAEPNEVRYDGDEADRDGEVLETPRQSFAYDTYQSGAFLEDAPGQQVESIGNIEDEFEHYQAGTGHVPRRDAKSVKGILKGAKSYNQEDFLDRPLSLKRANSFDAPAQQVHPGSPGNAALVSRIPSEAQVDGMVHPSPTSVRIDTHTPPLTTSATSESPLSSPPTSPIAPFAQPTFNASAPVLLPAPTSTQPIRSHSTPSAPRRIAFAPNLSVHTTWPAAVYDRRAEVATCNKLTPALAQRIKEELNAFKMEEMSAHPSSRQYTHFFV